MLLNFWLLEYHQALSRHWANDVDFTANACLRLGGLGRQSQGRGGSSPVLSPRPCCFVSPFSSSCACLHVSVQFFSACAFCSSEHYRCEVGALVLSSLGLVSSLFDLIGSLVAPSSLSQVLTFMCLSESPLLQSRCYVRAHILHFDLGHVYIDLDVDKGTSCGLAWHAAKTPEVITVYLFFPFFTQSAALKPYSCPSC